MNIAIPCDENGGNLPDPPPAPPVPPPVDGQDPASWAPLSGHGWNLTLHTTILLKYKVPQKILIRCSTCGKLPS